MILLTLAIVRGDGGLSILFYVLLVRIFASSSGLGQARPGIWWRSPPDGPTWARQTIMIGSVQWKRCVTIGMGQSGLYLRVDAILVPSSCRAHSLVGGSPPGKRLLYWRPAMGYR